VKKILTVLFSSLLLILLSDYSFAAKASYEGYKKCGGCHKSQKDSWLETKHANAFENLKPNKEAEAKKKAKLDPKKDYTSDEKCVGCHVTGYKQTKGYSERMSKTAAKYYTGVGCEECHGPGSLYRKDHRSASRKFKNTKEASQRSPLLKKGQVLEFEEECNRCHMNYEGSPWKNAKEPYTPFTPDIDKKYKFDYEKAVKESGKDKAMHEHFKLRGVFTGKPVSKFREEFQKGAKEPAEPEEDEGDEGDGGDEEGGGEDGE